MRPTYIAADELTRYESRMQQKNINEPAEAFELFFSDFSLTSTRQYLWELYQGWVMSERADNSDNHLRATLLFFYTHLEMLTEAAWLMHVDAWLKEDHDLEDLDHDLKDLMDLEDGFPVFNITGRINTQPDNVKGRIPEELLMFPTHPVFPPVGGNPPLPTP